MKKSILAFAFAGSLFVSQPIKPISSAANCVNGAIGIVLGVYFLDKALSTKVYKGRFLSKSLEVILFTWLGLTFIESGISILDK